MKSASLATLLALAIFAGGCAHRVAKPPRETSKPLSGERRGEGISQASLHEHYFALAHRVATAPNAPENINEDRHFCWRRRFGSPGTWILRARCSWSPSKFADR